MSNKGYMYILECKDRSYYTGSTRNIEKRLFEHQQGLGANFTKKRLPVKLVYMEEYDRIDEAFAREKQVQGWRREKKEALIRRDYGNLPMLASTSSPSASSPSASSGSTTNSTSSPSASSPSINSGGATNSTSSPSASSPSINSGGATNSTSSPSASSPSINSGGATNSTSSPSASSGSTTDSTKFPEPAEGNWHTVKNN